MNNAFAYDLVPAPSVIVAALKAARRVNDFPTAVRVFEGKSLSDHFRGGLGEYTTAVAWGCQGRYREIVLTQHDRN